MTTFSHCSIKLYMAFFSSEYSEETLTFNFSFNAADRRWNELAVMSIQVSSLAMKI